MHRTAPWLLLAMIMLPPCGVVWSGDTAADPDKLAIVELIEDQLAAAYIKRDERQTPDFGRLDRIFPDWHDGDPAGARRMLDNYRFYVVNYTVHLVDLLGPDTASVKGEKSVNLSRKTTFMKFFRRDETRQARYRFTMKCRRRENGGWYIMEELVE